MGYTHYFGKIDQLDAGKWAGFKQDVETLLTEHYNPSLKLVQESDNTQEPEITDKFVRFNGVGNNGHETFYFDRLQHKHPWAKPLAPYPKDHYYHNFCKTARKPYDLYVVAVLTLAEHHFGDAVKFTSDGVDEDLAKGRELAESVIAINNRPKKKQEPKPKPRLSNDQFIALSCELAHERVVEEHTGDDCANLITEAGSESCYTEDGQEFFDGMYDHYQYVISKYIDGQEPE